MKNFLIRWLPNILIALALPSLILCHHNLIVILAIAVIICTYISAVNVYLVNENVKKGITWFNPMIDYILAIVSALAYFGMFSWVITQPFSNVTMLLIIICSGSIAYVLEVKLKISEVKNGKFLHGDEMSEYKIVSVRTEKIFKRVSLCLTIISILLIFISLYLKWWIVFGVAIVLLIVVALAITIYEKFFTTQIEE